MAVVSRTVTVLCLFRVVMKGDCSMLSTWLLFSIVMFSERARELSWLDLRIRPATNPVVMLRASRERERELWWMFMGLF